ncbi:DMT family transporter [Dyella solisilvae]|uniref:DMT family transporter n=1 Tax=Dyella solisilvae TaxID=1920168 RepID=A0A370KB52_9GAMM|nr:DMT family transporter [Dyella solisilvae]RDI99878.1 DMT family transporter [Dyella solisilvae]
MNRTTVPRDVFAALAAAALFGASTPFAKLLVGSVSPFLLAGLLYLGSGIGLGLIRTVHLRSLRPPTMPLHEWVWWLGALLFGGVLGPLLLMLGLARTSASTASMLLNLEAVLTAVLAWVVFQENADRRIVAGMLLIVAGGLLLSWSSAADGLDSWLGPAAIAGACLCWAIDNNLTRKVSANDALFIAGSKGWVAGFINLSLGLVLGARLPSFAHAAPAMLIGFLGYGVSLVLFVLALRDLGSARTGAYFSTAPFIGAAIAIALFGEHATVAFWIATALMGAGVWLHLTERHEHEHTHEPMRHTHRHVHDEHHQHEHDFDWDGSEPHTHPHWHSAVTHTHPHFPDIHHRHRHR